MNDSFAWTEQKLKRNLNLLSYFEKSAGYGSVEVDNYRSRSWSRSRKRNFFFGSGSSKKLRLRAAPAPQH